MRFGSVASGIEAASVAWRPLGWEAAWLSEIEAFPSAVLAHHYPDVPNLGDMTTLPEKILSGEVEAPDLLCGGTPCQSFSVAGLRKSLDDARGNLSLMFCEIANAIDTTRRAANKPPAIIFWENVPGVLSTKDNAFGCFLAELAGEVVPLISAGGKWPNAGFISGPKRTVAWRILDAQYFGVAQRRRRVFVVASARDGFDPASVLFEFDGVRRDSAPSREAWESITHPAAACLTSSGRGVERTGDTRGQDPVVATFDFQSSGEYGTAPVASTIAARDYKSAKDLAVHLGGMQVRRLTPVECERLQGFPDNYTDIPWRKKPIGECPDGPRYKALGNSWAVPVVQWIGRRIDQEVKAIQPAPVRSLKDKLSVFASTFWGDK